MEKGKKLSWEDKSDIQDLIRLRQEEKFARPFREYLLNRKKKQSNQISRLKHRRNTCR